MVVDVVCDTMLPSDHCLKNINSPQQNQIHNSHVLRFLGLKKDFLQNQQDNSLETAIKLNLYIVNTQRENTKLTHSKNTSTHTQADHIWSSPLKERNTENSLTHKNLSHTLPHQHQTHTHTHVQCLAFLALLLLHCSANVILDMTPMFFPPRTR